MKKVFFIICFTAVTCMLSAQVFNTAETLKKGSFSLGVEPIVYTDGKNDYYLFAYGGIGLKRGLDFAIKLGLGDETYIGGDVEFALGKIISVSAGAHSWNVFALDGTLLLTLPITLGVSLYSGFDVDINVDENTDQSPFWVPIGLEVSLVRKMSVLFEGGIGVNDHAPNYLGGGISWFF
jgi:hypothetical protein